MMITEHNHSRLLLIRRLEHGCLMPAQAQNASTLQKYGMKQIQTPANR